MKKYSVYVKFKNGQDIQFETNTNVKMLQPFLVNGQPLIMTEEEHVLNLRHIKEIDLVKLR